MRRLQSIKEKYNNVRNMNVNYVNIPMSIESSFVELEAPCPVSYMVKVKNE
jgi:hypothetical protein